MGEIGEAPRPEHKLDESVLVNTREFLPTALPENYDPHVAILNFIGWGPDVEGEGYHALPEAMADQSGSRVIHIHTHATDSTTPLDVESRAALDQIVAANEGNNEIRRVVISGYSEGGQHALYAVRQARDMGIDVAGVALHAPTGLEEKSIPGIALSFIWDTSIEHPTRLFFEDEGEPISKREKTGSQKMRDTIRSGRDLAKGIAHEVAGDKFRKYPSRLYRDLKRMAKDNADLEDVTIPVLIIQGKHDRLAGPSKQDPANMFPNSPSVKRIVAGLSGNHPATLVRGERFGKLTGKWAERKLRQHGDDNTRHAA